MPWRPARSLTGRPATSTANGGIVVVEAGARNFGYWHVAPAVRPGSRVPLHGLLGHIAAQPEDWGHVHFAESTHDRNGITYWNPLRPGALSPFHDYGPPVIEAIIASLPPKQPPRTRRLLGQSTRQHTNRRHPTQAARLARHARHACPHPLAPDTKRQDGRAVAGRLRPPQLIPTARPRNPAQRHQLRRRLHSRHHTEQPEHARATTTSGSPATSTPTTTPTATTTSRSKQATSAATRERPPST